MSGRKKFWRNSCQSQVRKTAMKPRKLYLNCYQSWKNTCTANNFFGRPSKINIRGMRSRKDTPLPWSPPGSAGSPCTSKPVKTNSSAPEVRPVRPHSPVRHSTRQPSRTSLFYHLSANVDYTFMGFRLRSGLFRVRSWYINRCESQTDQPRQFVVVKFCLCLKHSAL